MTIEYEGVGLVLAQHGILNVSAEVHGMICGQLCSGAMPYSSELTGKILSMDGMPMEIQETFEEMASDIQNRMEDGNFDFTPLLPDDDEDLGLRIHALGRWCDGFNLGFAAGYSATGKVILDETKEVLADFARIAEVQDVDRDDEYEDDDEQENDYMEVVEYLRVAAASVYMQHNMKPEQDEGPNDVQEGSQEDGPIQFH